METAVPRLLGGAARRWILLGARARDRQPLRIAPSGCAGRWQSSVQRPESIRGRNSHAMLPGGLPALAQPSGPSTRRRRRTSILVPLQCEFFALEGLSQLLQTVEQVGHALNPELTVHGIVLTMLRQPQQSRRPGGGRCARPHG